MSTLIQREYRIAHLPHDAALDWPGVEPIHVDQFHPRSSDHHPTTTARLIRHRDALRLRFDVQDRYVVARHTIDQQLVCEDSCVEFFLQPGGAGYFNFEFNCCGVIHASYIEDPRRIDGEFARYMMLSKDDLAAITVRTSLTGQIDPEIAGPTDWWLEADIAVSLLDKFAGPLHPLSGRRMAGNFYKCAERSTHRHWASWNSIGERLNFHQPAHFAPLLLA